MFVIVFHIVICYCDLLLFSVCLSVRHSLCVSYLYVWYLCVWICVSLCVNHYASVNWFVEICCYLLIFVDMNLIHQCEPAAMDRSNASCQVSYYHWWENTTSVWCTLIRAIVITGSGTWTFCCYLLLCIGICYYVLIFVDMCWYLLLFIDMFCYLLLLIFVGICYYVFLANPLHHAPTYEQLPEAVRTSSDGLATINYPLCKTAISDTEKDLKLPLSEDDLHDEVTGDGRRIIPAARSSCHGKRKPPLQGQDDARNPLGHAPLIICGKHQC